MKNKNSKTIIFILTFIMSIYLHKIIKSEIIRALIPLILILAIYILYKINIKTLYKEIDKIANIAAIKAIINFKIPGTKNIIDTAIIHPTGIYIIDYIKYEGNISGTLTMDYWEIETADRKTYEFKNPVKEMIKNTEIMQSLFNEKIYPVIIFREKTYCYVLDGWINNNLMLIREHEQEEIFKNKEYVISYIRAEDIFENMKQFKANIIKRKYKRIR